MTSTSSLRLLPLLSPLAPPTTMSPDSMNPLPDGLIVVVKRDCPT